MTDDDLRDAMAASVPQRLRPRKWMPRDNGHQHGRINHSRVLSLAAEGHSARAIADAVFCEPRTVHAIIRDHRRRNEQ